METRCIGSLEVSVCGLGCNNFGGRLDQEATTRVVRAALEVGVNFFDTADIYGGTLSESYLGRALAPVRDDVVIATKFGMPVNGDAARSGASGNWIRAAVEDSLRRLGTDRIDLYQQHAPDPKTPIEETLETLDDLVRAGKVREIGNSNFTGAQIEEADDLSHKRDSARFVSAQNFYNMLNRGAEDEVLPACERRDVMFLPYFPLANGLLTGKYRRGGPLPEGARISGAPEERRAQLLSDNNFDVVERVEGFGRAHGRSVLEVTMAWLLSNGRIASVIAGATKPEQVRANAEASSIRLSAGDSQELTQVLAR